MRSRDDVFDEVMKKLSELHRVEFSVASLALWDRALQGFTAAEIAYAFDQHLCDPSPTYKLLPSVLTMHLVNRRAAAEHAFAVVESATRVVGASKGIAFEDPLIHTTISQLGGWVDCFYAIKNRELVVNYREKFGRAYERLATSMPMQHPAYLPGRADDGYFAVFGDQTAVERVVSSGYDPQKPVMTSYLPKPSDKKQLPPASGSTNN